MMKELWKRRTYPLSSSHLILEVDEVPIHEVCGLSCLAQELDMSLAGNEELLEGWKRVQSAQWDSYKKYWWGAYPSCWSCTCCLLGSACAVWLRCAWGHEAELDWKSSDCEDRGEWLAWVLQIRHTNSLGTRPYSGNGERVLVRAGTSTKYIRKRKTYINNVTTPLERLSREKPPCSLNVMIAVDDAVLRHPIFEDALRGRQLLNKQMLHCQNAHLVHWCWENSVSSSGHQLMSATLHHLVDVDCCSIHLHVICTEDTITLEQSLLWRHGELLFCGLGGDELANILSHTHTQ